MRLIPWAITFLVAFVLSGVMAMAGSPPWLTVIVVIIFFLIEIPNNR